VPHLTFSISVGTVHLFETGLRSATETTA